VLGKHGRVMEWGGVYPRRLADLGDRRLSGVRPETNFPHLML